MSKQTTPTLDKMYERSWAEMRDDPDEIVACGERWKAVAASIGCTLHGFNDDRTASFLTPDGRVIEVGPRFRAALIQQQEATIERLSAALAELRKHCHSETLREGDGTES